MFERMLAVATSLFLGVFLAIYVIMNFRTSTKTKDQVKRDWLTEPLT